MSSEQKKQERDYTPEVDALLPEVTKAGQVEQAIEKILALEKQTRNASDLKSTTRLAETLLTLTHEAHNYKLLTNNLILLSKKHGQLKGVVQAMVELVMTWLEGIKESEGVDTWLAVIHALRDVTEGKIFLETPRARVTLLLSHYHESLTDVASTPSSHLEHLQTASDLLSELQVETYSSMERREKTEFLLEQMRLLVRVAKGKDEETERVKEGKARTPAAGDDAAKAGLVDGEAEWVKVRVGGRKVNETFLKEEKNEDLKLKYYDLMIQYSLYQLAYLEVAKHYQKIWETPSIKADEAGKGRQALEYIVYYILLAPHDNEQSDTLHHLFVDPALAKMELHYNLVKCFVTRELMRWSGIEGIYGPTLRATTVFGPGGEKQWEDLHTRVIEHNVRVVAHYYTRIRLSRLQTLLDLSAQQTEDTLSRLVTLGSIWARMDRPAGIVNFVQKRSAEDIMNDWSSDMNKLLGLVEKSWMGMNAALAAQARSKA